MVKNQIQSFRHAGIVVSNIKKTSDIFGDTGVLAFNIGF